MTTAPQTADVLTPLARTVSGVCHGTLGELFQGPVEGGIGLVSFPVDRYSWAHFSSGGEPDPLPPLPKAAHGAALFLEHYGFRLPPGRWFGHTELDVGVGMASSTADIVATLRCLFQAFGQPYDLAVVIDILSRIERADSVFLDEFALYLSDRHRVVTRLGTAIGFHTCYVVEPGAVDTSAVTPSLLDHYQRRARAYQSCLDTLIAAFLTNDAAGVARAASISAALSQEVPAQTHLRRRRRPSHRLRRRRHLRRTHRPRDRLPVHRTAVPRPDGRTVRVLPRPRTPVLVRLGWLWHCMNTSPTRSGHRT